MTGDSKPNAPGFLKALIGYIGFGIMGLLCLFLGLSLAFGPNLWFAYRADSAALEAARERANLFLDALRNEDGGSAYGLLSKDYRERLPAPERDLKKMDVSFPLAVGQRPAEWKLGTGKLSDGRHRATFEGTVSLKSGQEHPFRLIVVTESESWRVELFTVQR